MFVVQLSWLLHESRHWMLTDPVFIIVDHDEVVRTAETHFIIVDHDEVVRTAETHGSGESSLFSNALGFLSDNKVNYFLLCQHFVVAVLNISLFLART